MAALCLSCVPAVNEFECQESSECMAAGVAGTCEPNGYCSFPDEECSSGQRYGEQAPEVIAGKCVESTGSTGTDTDSGGGTGSATTSGTAGPSASSSSGADGSTGTSTTGSADASSSETGETPPQPDGDPAEGTISLPLGATINAAAAHPDGGIIVAGTTPLIEGDRELVLVHMDADAQPAWAVTSDGIRNDQYFDVVVTADGVFATGITRSLDLAGVVSNQLLVSEFTLGGELVRHVVFASDDDHEGWGITALSAGGFAIVGNTSAPGFGEEDGLLLVVDADLQPVLEVAIGTPTRDRLRAVSEVGGDLLVAGRLANDMGIARISTFGTVVWSRIRDAAGTIELRDLAQLSDGSWIAVGESEALDTESQGVMIGFEDDGTIRWTGAAFTPRSDTCGGVIADDEGAWLMGTTESADGTTVPWLTRLDTDTDPPTVQWSTGYPMDSVDAVRGPAVARRVDGGLGMAFATLGVAGPTGLSVLYTDSAGGVGELCSATLLEPLTTDLAGAPPPLSGIEPITGSVELERVELGAGTLPVQMLAPTPAPDACD